jgi:hypothetical protein
MPPSLVMCAILRRRVTLAELTLQNGINGLLVNTNSTAPEVTPAEPVADNLFLGLSVGGGVHARLMDNQITNNGSVASSCLMTPVPRSSTPLSLTMVQTACFSLLPPPRCATMS